LLRGDTNFSLTSEFDRWDSDDVRFVFGYDTRAKVIGEARQRCNQENVIGQLKRGVRALHAPVNTLNANWAYMTMASIVWTLKAWCALLLPVSPRWAELHNEQQRRLLTMEFRTFRHAFIDMPCQIVKTAARTKLVDDVI